MGDSSDLKRTSRRAKKRPNFFKAEPATLASAGDFAKPPAAAPKRKRQASTTLESGEKKLKVDPIASVLVSNFGCVMCWHSRGPLCR